MQFKDNLCNMRSCLQKQASNQSVQNETNKSKLDIRTKYISIQVMKAWTKALVYRKFKKAQGPAYPTDEWLWSPALEEQEVTA